MAAARAIAAIDGVPLWKTFAGSGTAARLPVPHFNVVNGGVHAPNELDFQEFMLAPLGSPNEAEAVRAGADRYAVLKRRLAGKGLATGLGDEAALRPRSPPPRTCSRYWWAR